MKSWLESTPAETERMVKKIEAGRGYATWIWKSMILRCIDH